MKAPDRGYWQLLSLAAIAVGTVFASFLWQAHLGFGLEDEGFLWYGVKRVIAGEVPLRDFMSYDPGRYYWSGAALWLWGNHGLVALRAAISVFEALCLWLGLVMLSRQTRTPNLGLWLLAAVALVTWMNPIYRVFDMAIAIVPVAALAYLIERNDPRRAFLAGLCVGLVAIVGRNHGVYAAFGSLGVLAYLAFGHSDVPGRWKSLAAWLSGVAIGYGPVIAMMALVPGFATALWDSVRLLGEMKATNLPLAIPYPWRVPLLLVSPIEALQGLLQGCCFILILGFGLVGIGWSIRRRSAQRPVAPAFVAAAFMALPYAHIAFSRADTLHLATSMVPVVLGCFVWLADQPARLKWPFAALICGTSMIVILPIHAGWLNASQHWVDVTIAGDTLKVAPWTAQDVALLQKLVAQFAPDHTNFVATPYWPGAYALFERKSPMWENYALVAHTEAFQNAEIERIKRAKPGFLLVWDHATDGREELRFRNTHPLIDRYIVDHYKHLEGYSQRRGQQVYIRIDHPKP